MLKPAIILVALASTTAHAEPSPQRQARVDAFMAHRAKAISQHELARGWFYASMYAHRHNNPYSAGIAMHYAREKLASAIGSLEQAYGVVLEMSTIDGHYYFGVADALAALLYTTKFGLFYELAYTSWSEDGVQLLTDDGLPATYYPADNSLLVNFANGGYQVTYEDGSSTIKVGPNADTIHLSAMGTCLNGCQIQGATVIFPPDHGRLGDTLPLPFDPLGPFVAAMIAQDIMMNQPLP